MALPVDEGRPSFTNRTGISGQLVNGANFATAIRMVTLDETNGDEVDYALYFTTPSDIHNQTQFTITNPTATELTRQMQMTNALSYDAKVLPAVLLDLIQHQAHAGRGVLRMVPNGDVGTNQFTRSSGSLGHWEYVDENADAPNTSDYLETTTVSQKEQFALPSLPSNGSRIHEAIITAWMQLRVGTDTGLAFQCVLYNGASPIGAGDVYLWVRPDDTIRMAQAKIERLDTSAATWAGCHMEVVAARGAAGGTPNPRWRLYAIDLLGYYEVSDVEIVNVASFNNLAAFYYGSYQLDFSVWDGTFRSLVLDVLKHAPELGLYCDYNGKLSLGRVQAYSAVGSPFALAPAILEVKRGPYRYTQRTANAVLVKWGVTVPHDQAADSAEDPVNGIPDRGSRRVMRASSAIVRRGLPDPKELDRHFIRTAALAGYMGDSYVHLWGEDVDALEVVCDMRAIEVEPFDVVSVTRADLGMSARKFAVVEKTLNLDDDTVTLSLYDIEFTRADYS